MNVSMSPSAVVTISSRSTMGRVCQETCTSSARRRDPLADRCDTPWAYFDHPTSPPLIDHSDRRIAMSAPDPDAAYAVLREADPEVMDRDQLADVVRHCAQLVAWTDSVKVRATRRLRALADEGRAEA